MANGVASTASSMSSDPGVVPLGLGMPPGCSLPRPGTLPEAYHAQQRYERLAKRRRLRPRFPGPSFPKAISKNVKLIPAAALHVLRGRPKQRTADQGVDAAHRAHRKAQRKQCQPPKPDRDRDADDVRRRDKFDARVSALGRSAALRIQGLSAKRKNRQAFARFSPHPHSLLSQVDTEDHSNGGSGTATPLMCKTVHHPSPLRPHRNRIPAPRSSRLVSTVSASSPPVSRDSSTSRPRPMSDPLVRTPSAPRTPAPAPATPRTRPTSMPTLSNTPLLQSFSGALTSHNTPTNEHGPSPLASDPSQHQGTALRIGSDPAAPQAPTIRRPWALYRSRSHTGLTPTLSPTSRTAHSLRPTGTRFPSELSTREPETYLRSQLARALVSSTTGIRAFASPTLQAQEVQTEEEEEVESDQDSISNFSAHGAWQPTQSEEPVGTTRTEVIWEHQRGIVLLGTPRFSPQALVIGDPGAWVSGRTGRQVSWTTANSEVPPAPGGPGWSWAWPRWAVDMRLDTDEAGWSYARNFGHQYTRFLRRLGAIVPRSHEPEGHQRKVTRDVGVVRYLLAQLQPELRAHKHVARRGRRAQVRKLQRAEKADVGFEAVKRSFTSWVTRETEWSSVPGALTFVRRRRWIRVARKMDLDSTLVPAFLQAPSGPSQPFQSGEPRPQVKRPPLSGFSSQAVRPNFSTSSDPETMQDLARAALNTVWTNLIPSLAPSDPKNNRNLSIGTASQVAQPNKPRSVRFERARSALDQITPADQENTTKSAPKDSIPPSNPFIPWDGLEDASEFKDQLYNTARTYVDHDSAWELIHKIQVGLNGTRVHRVLHSCALDRQRKLLWEHWMGLEPERGVVCCVSPTDALEADYQALGERFDACAFTLTGRRQSIEEAGIKAEAGKNEYLSNGARTFGSATASASASINGCDNLGVLPSPDPLDVADVLASQMSTLVASFEFDRSRAWFLKAILRFAERLPVRDLEEQDELNIERATTHTLVQEVDHLVRSVEEGVLHYLPDQRKFESVRFPVFAEPPVPHQPDPTHFPPPVSNPSSSAYDSIRHPPFSPHHSPTLAGPEDTDAQGRPLPSPVSLPPPLRTVPSKRGGMMFTVPFDDTSSSLPDHTLPESDSPTSASTGDRAPLSPDSLLLDGQKQEDPDSTPGSDFGDAEPLWPTPADDTAVAKPSHTGLPTVSLLDTQRRLSMF